ncbi:cyclic nucleotide-binding domain-containing protein [Candidatus Peregrinibacteria bacterium]|nr:cyclic nucleotide-binding domain-containing protein [Candidatus Peregrinibacteria bacterium]
MEDINPMLNILAKIPLFKDLSDDSKNLILNSITLQYFPKGHKVFNKGDAGDAMYIIKKGLVKIYLNDSDDPDEQTILAELADNAFFGEMALVSEKPRNANAVCMIDSEIFMLKKDDFNSLITNNPSIAEQISTEFITRVKSNDQNPKMS